MMTFVPKGQSQYIKPRDRVNKTWTCHKPLAFCTAELYTTEEEVSARLFKVLTISDFNSTLEHIQGE